METRSPFSNQASETSGNATMLPDAVAKVTQHICVCICTYKRPQLLRRLLSKLADQETGGLFTYSIVIADNDRLESAQHVVSEFASSCAVPIKYYVETRQSIALTRNKAIENASGDFVAFIDDDEFPRRNWLLTLLNTCRQYGVDGVLGPVKPHFDTQPPRWVVRGRFYERSTYPTGLVIDWRKGRTGNVLLRKELFTSCAQPFNPDFRQGEDQEFFHRAIQKGFKFVWCDEAVAYETVPPIRWKRTFMLRRALLRGAMEPRTPNFGARDIAKSLVATPTYALALPFTLMVGHHTFMSLLVRLFDHLGKLLALLGINLVKEPYVTG